MSNLLEDLPIKHIRLVNGDQIVSYVQHLEDDTVILEQPLQLHPVMSTNERESKTYTFYFTRYMPLTDNRIVHLNPVNIVTYSDVTDDVMERYISSALEASAEKDRDDRINQALDDTLKDFRNDLDGVNTLH
jgi:hypothetical protein